MKKLFLMTIALVIANGVFGQYSYQGMEWGIRAGVNFPTYGLSGSDEQYTPFSSTSFHLTGFVDIPIAQHKFYFQPGLSLQGKGSIIVSDRRGKVTQSTLWLEVPMNFVARFAVVDGSGIFGGIGPYVAYGLSGNNNYDISWRRDHDEFAFGNEGTLKNLDYGVNIIAGYEFLNKMLVHVGYSLGLSDLRGAYGNNNRYFPEGKVTNRAISIGVGYNF